MHHCLHRKWQPNLAPITFLSQRKKNYQWLSLTCSNLGLRAPLNRQLVNRFPRLSHEKRQRWEKILHLLKVLWSSVKRKVRLPETVLISSSSSSSSYLAASTDIPDPLSPLFPYRSSPLAGLLGYIPYLHIAAVCKFLLVVLLQLGHMWGSRGIHHLCARSCSSSSILRAWFV